MIVDELILKLQADLQDVKKALKNVESDAAKSGKEAGAAMGKAAGTSFGDVFNAIAGAAVANTVKGFFSRAAGEFNKLEAAFLRADSIAKGFGRSIDKARKNVDELANKGFLNLNQSASAYADAIALGFDETQARKFIDALSDVAAFQNTIGDGAAAVQSGLQGLLSNSSEKVENIGVPIKVLNMQYNENIKTMGKAAAMQKFYNGVLKESAKFTGDAAKAVDTLKGAQDGFTASTEKAMAAVGKGLEPALKSFYKTLTILAEGFAKWFGNLDSGSKSIILFGGALATVVPAIMAVGKAIALLSFNPIILTIAAVVAATTAIAVAVNELSTKYKPENVVKRYKESADEAKKLGDRVEQLNAVNKRTIAQEIELAKSKEELRKKAQALGLDYDALAAKAKNYSDVIDAINNKQRDTAAADIDRERMRLAENVRAYDKMIKEAERATGRNIKDLAMSGVILPGGFEARGLLSGREGAVAAQRDADLRRAGLYASPDGTMQPVAGADAAGGKGSPEFRFIRARDELRKLDLEYENYIKKVGAKSPEGQEALTKLGIERGALTNELKQATAEYIEDRTEAALFAEQAAYQKARANIFELANAEKLSKEEVEKRIQKAREANIRRNAQIEAQSFAATLQAANATIGGIGQMANARGQVGAGLSGLGSTLTGLSGFKELFPALSVLGPVGQGIGAVGGIVSTLTSLWGKSDEERAREAEQQKRRDEEAKSILELQANYQKSMLALQEAAAKLPFENLSRQLRLIDIEAQSQRLAGGSADAIEAQRLASRQAAMQSTLTEQSGAIGAGAAFSGVQATPQGLTQFLSERAAQTVAVAQFMQLLDAVASGNLTLAQYEQVNGQLKSYKGKIPDELYDAARRYSVQGGGFYYTDDFGYGGSRTTYENGVQTTTVNASAEKISAARAIASEITSDVTIASDLLSVIEQSQQTQLEIAANTKKTAENTSQLLRPDRQRSFIDVGQGFISSLGQRISPSAVGIARSLSQQGLSLPSEIGMASTTSTLAKTLQERMAEAMEVQVRQGARANDLLSGILRATIELYRVMDGNPATVSGFDNAAADAWLADRERRRF